MAIDETAASPDPPTLDWQLTPSNSRPLAAVQLLAWLLLGGAVTLFLAVVTVLGVLNGAALLDIALSGSIAFVAVLVAIAVGGGPALSWLAGRKHGRVWLRLRLPEPTDPGRSIVEHANTTVLAVLAAVGAGGSALLFAIGGLALRVGAVTLVAVYVACWLCRWLLPTAGRLSADRLTLTAWPESDTGRSWHGALTQTATLDRNEITGVRRLSLGKTAIVSVQTETWPPVVAAVPTAVADRLAERSR